MESLTGARSVRVYRFPFLSSSICTLYMILLFIVSSLDSVSCVLVNTHKRALSLPGNLTNTLNAEHATVKAQHPTSNPTNAVKANVPSWDYSRHGADWTSGMCNIGAMQSPVDLHVETPSTNRQHSLKSLFDHVLSGSSITNDLNEGWKRGDVVYSYHPFISTVKVLRNDKVFRISIPANEGSIFGSLFTTDRPNLYAATHIDFHSPSEHTFEGSANRRHVEVQIWHYYGDDGMTDEGVRAIDPNAPKEKEEDTENKEESDEPKEEETVSDNPEEHHNEQLGDATGQSGNHIDGNTIPQHPEHGNNVNHELHHSSETALRHHPSDHEKSDIIYNHHLDNHNLKSSCDVVDTAGNKVDASHLLHQQNTNDVMHETAKAHHGHYNHRLDGSEFPNASHISDAELEHHIDEFLSKEIEVPPTYKPYETESSNMRAPSHADHRSFIEILSDVEMANGEHVISPSGGKERIVKKVTAKKIDTSVNQEDKDLQSTLSKKAQEIAGMLKDENVDMLHKYLLQHLENVSFNEERIKRHNAGKRRARDVGTHWGRWAVLSLTFMSEEMNDTPIETLQSYPSELFMEQVLKIGSSIAVQPETGSPSVGDLTVEGNMELPVVDLETPINLPSLFLMLENKNVSYFAYDGSFTYPGCEETVRWYVAKDPLPISTELMLQINRMLNQKRTSESANNNVNKYRELQNVDPNIHHTGKVYMVHGYPMEYFIATSLQRPPILPLPRPSGFFTPYWGLCIALVVVVFTQL